MNEKHGMGCGDVQSDWPELEPDRRNDQPDPDDADAAPDLTEEENRPGVPASDPESGA
ncbi:hypothetical protein [Pseudomonas mosselii]|uniref:Uncharacterized protein n=1 Tax=Pseudomonas mosselii TaxID=78327 RepID=A0ABX9B9V9_9PSED|nr:hypothetical protein [Pseudomonas mosselii]MCL8302796.1 hypothetical protein [Pseudomonas mosselii]MCL8340811.1 hypothetical protein [Pseudomonas mosselii]MCU9528939.1 hypothetical protein [Pseudomonas mosselii]MCU9536893.1 hypothetical protein [Pseudomonas mosselii]MCU9542573.1 hypothetical protein [Pseudomonas mosselii]